MIQECRVPDLRLEELLRERRCLLQGREEFQVLWGGGHRVVLGLVLLWGRERREADPKRSLHAGGVGVLRAAAAALLRDPH